MVSPSMRKVVKLDGHQLWAKRGDSQRTFHKRSYVDFLLMFAKAMQMIETLILIET